MSRSERVMRILLDVATCDETPLELRMRAARELLTDGDLDENELTEQAFAIVESALTVRN